MIIMDSRKTNRFYKMLTCSLLVLVSACQAQNGESLRLNSHVPQGKLKAEWKLCITSAHISSDLVSDIIAMDDGSLIVSGRFYRKAKANLGPPKTSLISNISSKGRIKWMTELEGIANIHRLLLTNENNISAFGSTQNSLGEPKQATLYKLSKNGNLISQITLEGPKFFREIRDAIQLSNGHYIITGTYQKTENAKSVFLAEIDENGKNIWTKTYPNKKPGSTLRVFKRKQEGYALIFVDYQATLKAPKEAANIRQVKRYTYNSEVVVLNLDGAGDVKKSFQLNLRGKQLGINLRALYSHTGDTILTFTQRNWAEKQNELTMLILDDDINVKRQVVITTEPVQINDIQQSQNGTIYTTGKTRAKDFGKENLWFGSFSSDADFLSESYLNTRGIKDWANALYLDETSHKISFVGQSKKVSFWNAHRFRRKGCVWVVQTNYK